MIYYFSGTGNSYAVAVELARLTGDRLQAMQPKAAPGSGPADTGSGDGRTDIAVWVFPIYSWGLPRPVVQAVRRLAVATPGCKHYMVATCGDDAGLADRQWQREIGRKGCTATGAATVVMPNTYTMMKGFDVDSRQLAAAKVAAMPARVAEIAAMIESGEPFADVLRGKFAWLKSKIIYPWFMRFATATRPFHATGGCISCGLCQRECPAGCISMDSDSRPQWDATHCYMCERCYHQCPRHAIAYGRATRGKGQYCMKYVQ